MEVIEESQCESKSREKRRGCVLGFHRFYSLPHNIHGSRTKNHQQKIDIAQLIVDWLIRLPIRTCVKPPVTLDCSLAPKLLFVDWL